jgi:hypothetical protein
VSGFCDVFGRYAIVCRTHWPRVPRHGSADARLLELRGFKSRREHGCLSFVNVVRGMLSGRDLSRGGRSLVQRSLTECHVSEGDREASTVRRPCPIEAVAPWKKKKMLYHKSPSWNRVCGKRLKIRQFWFCFRMKEKSTFLLPVVGRLRTRIETF